MAHDLSNWDLRCGYTLTVAQLAQLLHVSDDVLRRHLTPVVDGHLSLAYLGKQVPASRDHNGNVRFLTADADEAFGLRPVP